MELQQNPFSHLRPSAEKVMSQTNYVSVYDWSTYHQPDKAEEMATIYGNQSVAGMLQMIGAEGTYSEDLFIWTEEGRLHTVYNSISRSANVFTQPKHIFRPNETVVLNDGTSNIRGVILEVTADTFTLAAYGADALTGFGTSNIIGFKDGSEFRKGTRGMQGTIHSNYTTLSNKGIIHKDSAEYNGSDITSVGWIKTDAGYLWYLKDEHDRRRRFEDIVELMLINGERAQAGSEAMANGYEGTEGFFDAIRKRGQNASGMLETIEDVDTIVKRLDKEGKIQDYMFYVDREQSLAIDNMLGKLNSGHENGISYGIFNNSKDMAINLGFKGFTRGSYNFFKADWKLLNDPTLLGSIPKGAGKTHGVLIPVGQKEVYEGTFNGGSGTGKKTTRPFLQLLYRSHGIENRKHKTWVTGSVGGAHTDDEDVMRVHDLTERMLNTIGANNFFLFED